MKLQIDCYTKEEFAVQIDYSGRYPIEQGEKGELFLFACYTLKQLYNLGDHMVADALAGLISENPVAVMNSERELPSGSDILIIKPRSVLQLQGEDETQIALQTMKVKRELESNAMVKILENDFISSIPNLRLIKYKGNAKKQFILTLPPLNLQMKGFGFLFGDVRFYSLTSTLILYKYLAIKYKNNSSFLMRLIGTSTIIATAHYFKKIPMDIPGLANNIISELYDE